jgi:hypothetical protein
MTLLPSDNWNVTAVDRPAYKVNDLCAAPGCTRHSDHAHHLWRRSAGTNTAWVCLAYLEDKPIIGNLIGLCQEHHADVTGNIGGHRARIFLNDKLRRFVWLSLVGPTTGYVGALKFQPPGLGASEEALPNPTRQDSASPEAELAEELDEAAQVVQGFLDPQLDDVPAVMREAAKVLRRRAQRAQKRVTQSGDLPVQPTRKKKSWTVKVPDDTEDGYDVLESLLDAAAEKLGRGDERSALTRYFTVVEALVFLLQHEVEA